jgi:hypothetical protein
MTKLKQNIVQNILEHPNKEEIISKLLIGITPKDIHEWLSATYSDINEQKFILSEKTIKKFQDEYLDIYTHIKDDLVKVKSPNEELRDEIISSPSYHKALEKYIDSEIDIRTIVKKMVVNAQERMSQMYDIIQEDPRNFKADRTIIEWFSALSDILSKYDAILNPPNLNNEQINIQNNINIQVLDTHMNMVYDIIREILTMLDYDTSLRFMELWENKMQAIKPVDTTIIPIETRLEIVKKLEDQIENKLNP